MLSRILILIPIWIILDIYFFQSIKTVTNGMEGQFQQIIYWLYWVFDVLLIGVILYLVLLAPPNFLPNKVVFVLIGLVLLSLVPKLLTFPFLFLEDLYRIANKLVNINKGQLFPARRVFISQFVLALAAVPFGAILYGMIGGKYNYRIHRKTLTFDDLPIEFDGFTITQLSDIHAGSFDNARGVERGVDLANQQQSNLLVFTGDMVNNEASELNEWKNTFKKLHAPLGKYSILGNHDYGDYHQWPSAEAKRDNLEQLKAIQKEMGFRLLMDEAVSVTHKGAKINLVGVQNWGARGFAQYGNLDKAMRDVEPATFTVLLSHDPSHWEAQTLKHPKHIHLTLAGHTHGMQFGIEVPGIRWSPVQYVYKQWAGIYKKKGRFLHVNRGFGFIGFSGRVGIMPEVTVITLKKA